jgi:hypothetical protein
MVHYRSTDLTGRKFSRLLVLGRAPRRGSNPHWRCQCECGKTTEVMQHRLTTCQTKSCGCLIVEAVIKRSYRHGHNTRKARTSEHAIWSSMIQRCTNPKCKAFPRYGGRGITIYPPWLVFENFLRDVGLRPSPKLSLDRYPDPDGPYEPTNVRWATAKQQYHNSTRRGTTP